jgi:hypothetical protein
MVCFGSSSAQPAELNDFPPMPDTIRKKQVISTFILNGVLSVNGVGLTRSLCGHESSQQGDNGEIFHLRVIRSKKMQPM